MIISTVINYKQVEFYYLHITIMKFALAKGQHSSWHQNQGKTYIKGPSTNYVVSKSAIFDPLPPLIK